MSAMACLALAAAAFVGTHFLMSHPLRSPMVSRLGERGFQGLYSLISLLTLGWMILVYWRLGDQAPLWTASEPVWVVANLAMWFASILLAGSFAGNPALPGAPRVAAPRSVMAITRHPMMWAFALWALVHFALIATPKAAIFDGAIILLALGGSAGQDHKKLKLHGEKFHEWSAQTAFFPFGRGLKAPGTFAFMAGTGLFLLATWLHPMPVAVWRWIG